MARIPMTSGFVLIPEGEYVFRIYDATYDEDFGKIEVKMVNAQGMTHTERFSIKDKDDQYNEKALNAFSYFAKTAMDDFSLEDVDPEELIGHYIRAEVIHTEVPSNKDPNKTVTFANLGDKSPAEGFDETPTERALTLGKGNTMSKPQPTAPKAQAQPTAPKAQAQPTAPKAQAQPTAPKAQAQTAPKKGLDLDSLLG